MLQGGAALALAGFVGAWHARRLAELTEGEVVVGSSSFVVVGFGGLLLALFALLRGRRRGPPLRIMPCGGTMTPDSFEAGSAYGVCTARCTHSRADFERAR